MKLGRRDREAPPVEPPVKLTSGTCPTCSGLSIFDDDRCKLCGGSRRITYPSEWSEADRERLRDVWERETTLQSVAFEMRRPIHVVRDEAVRQGLYPDSPDYITVRPFDPKFKGGVL